MLALGLRWAWLGDKSLWIDEAFTEWVVQQPLTAGWRSTVQLDQHPPLYYTLLHWWLGHERRLDEVALRALSAVAGAATVPFVHLIGRAAGGSRVGLVAAAVLAVSPWHVGYSQQARMYALMTLAAAIAISCLATVLARPAGRVSWLLWAGYAVFTAATMLSHNTGVFLPVAVLVALAWTAAARRWRRRDPTLPHRGHELRSVALATLAGVALWVPWLPVFLDQAARVDAEFWIRPPTLDAVAVHVANLLSGRLPAELAAPLAVLAIACAAFGAVVIRRRSPLLAVLLVALVVGPVLGELVVSLRRPIFYSQTMLWTIGPFAVLLGAAVAELRRRVAIGVAVAVLVGLNGSGLAGYYRDSGPEDWRGAAAVVAAGASPGDLVLFDAGWTQLAFDHYYDRSGGPRIEVHGLPAELFERGVLEPKMTTADLPRLDALVAGRDRVWVVYSHEWYTDPDARVEGRLATTLVPATAHGFRSVRVVTYHAR